METIFENEIIKISETGRDYDFIAIIENKTDNEIDIEYQNGFIQSIITIYPNDWIGVLADADGYIVLDSLKNKNFKIKKRN